MTTSLKYSLKKELSGNLIAIGHRTAAIRLLVTALSNHFNSPYCNICMSGTRELNRVRFGLTIEREGDDDKTWLSNSL